jgi:hypothetical protein
MIKCMNTYYGNNTTNINNINNINNILEEYLNTRREEPNTIIRSNDDIMLLYRDWWQLRYNILPNIAETKIPIRETSNKVAECM